ncbi:MAG TPA: helix-turn-helix domain-containing protein [Bdellovibrionota bacterium]|nr:helix-turn-helix domain-containing protein [Bdellovibrionota bacterium]
MSKAIWIRSDVADVSIRPRRAFVASVIPEIRDILERYGDYVDSREVVKKIAAEAGADFRSPGYLIRVFRAREGLTQTELARKVKIPQSDLSRIERNTLALGRDRSRRISRILKIDYRRLLS